MPRETSHRHSSRADRKLVRTHTKPSQNQRAKTSKCSSRRLRQRRPSATSRPARQREGRLGLPPRTGLACLLLFPTLPVRISSSPSSRRRCRRRPSVRVRCLISAVRAAAPSQSLKPMRPSRSERSRSRRTPDRESVKLPLETHEETSPSQPTRHLSQLPNPRPQ